ncbi:hypothetical protein ACUR5C_00220 [Aliikangiella sp. IMCC44653]
MNFKFLALGLALIVFAGLFTSRTIWVVDLDSGSQSYHRLVFGVEVKSLSEYDYLECSGNWKNPRPDLKGVQTISNCNLVSICEASEVESAVLSNGCRT